MGRHADEGRRRGIAGWPIVTAGLVVLIAAASIAYFVVSGKDESPSQAECARQAVVPISASTGAAPALTAAAKAYDATAPKVRSACITTVVTTADGAAIGAALAGSWQPDLGSAPSIWAADNPAHLTALEKTHSELTAGRDVDPLATSPVVLAVRSVDAAGIAGLTWNDLPGDLGAAPLPSGDNLAVALPDPRTNRATAFALQSVLAVSDTKPLDSATVTKNAASIQKLVAAAPSAPTTTQEALKALADRSAKFTAVPVIESELVAFNRRNASDLAAVYPLGPSAGDAIIVAPLDADWMDETQHDASAAFHGYLRNAGQQSLVTAGLRVPGLTPLAVPGVDLGHPVTALVDAEQGVVEALATAMGLTAGPGETSPKPPPSAPPSSAPPSSAPPSSALPSSAPPSSPPPSSTPAPGSSPAPPTLSGPVVTLVVDTSQTMGTVVAERTRLDWLSEGARQVIAGGGQQNLGLWSFSSNDGGEGFAQRVPTTPPGGEPSRDAALEAALGNLTPGGTRTTYAVVVAAYRQAVEQAVPGRTNRVVLITDGADQTPATPRAGVVAQLTELAAAGTVRLDIVGVGEAAPAEALTALATAGGGSYTAVPDTPGLPAALLAVVNG